MSTADTRAQIASHRLVVAQEGHPGRLAHPVAVLQLADCPVLLLLCERDVLCVPIPRATLAYAHLQQPLAARHGPPHSRRTPQGARLGRQHAQDPQLAPARGLPEPGALRHEADHQRRPVLEGIKDCTSLSPRVGDTRLKLAARRCGPRRTTGAAGGGSQESMSLSS